MRHLSILMWIKVHYNQNTFTGFEFSNFITVIQKNFLKLFGKVKILKSQAGFELMTYRFVVNPLTHCTMLLGDNFGKETIDKITLDFIVYVDK